MCLFGELLGAEKEDGENEGKKVWPFSREKKTKNWGAAAEDDDDDTFLLPTYVDSEEAVVIVRRTN